MIGGDNKVWKKARLTFSTFLNEVREKLVLTFFFAFQLWLNIIDWNEGKKGDDNVTTLKE